jgi:hypothetical protein
MEAETQEAGSLGLQAKHLPPKHFVPLPQSIPSETAAPSMHWGSPVAQEVVPVLQMFAGMHAAFGLHEMHVPPWQYMS